MASEQDDTVFDQDFDDDDESSQDDDDDVLVNDDVLADEEDEDDLNYVSPSTSSPAAVPVAVPSASAVTVAVPNGGDDALTAATESAPDVKRQRLAGDSMAIVVQEEKKPLPPPAPQLDDQSRRLFQRLWTDEDEIELLRGFLDYTTQRGGNHHDTAQFYDQIKSKLQLDFNKNQLVEKLRRLKKKYRNVVSKISSGKDFSFKSPHDQTTFEISRKIWSNAIGKTAVEDSTNLDDEDGNPNPNSTPNFNNGELVKIDDQKSTPRSRKRSRSRTAPVGVKFDDVRVISDAFVASNDNNNNVNSSNSNAGVSGLIEETVRSCLSPLFKDLLSNMAAAAGPCGGRGIGGLAMNAMPLSFGGGEMMVDEKWRKQQILELEVYSKRLELVLDQIKAQLKELRSMGG